ncbi:MAG: hypothetical protein FVQ77_10235 [Cytophagales bacterium]|nr:hypothetical protein [Cytophagales bacterium]
MTVMKILLPFFYIIFIPLFAWAQSEKELMHLTNWEFNFSKSIDEVKAGDEIDLVISVLIDDDWFLYSSDFDPDLGPMPAEFHFEENDSYELVDSTKAVNSKKKYDEMWEGDYTYFKHNGEFRQTIKVLKETLSVKGSQTYQLCSEIDGSCIPFEAEFVFQFKK